MDELLPDLVLCGIHFRSLALHSDPAIAMNPAFIFLCGFLTAAALFGALAAIYYAKALKRVRTMQKYMQQDAAKIVHAAAKDIYGTPEP